MYKTEQEEKEPQDIHKHDHDDDRGTYLSPEIIELILQKLPILDYPKLRATCSTWKEAIDNMISHKHLSPLPQFPYILFSNNNTNQFLSLSQERIHSMVGCACVGSIEGWLVLNPSPDQILFLNPVSNHKIMLPPPTTITLPTNSTCLFKQVVASCAPDSSDCIVAARVYAGEETRVIFCRIKDKSWTQIECEYVRGMHFASIAIHGNILYSINCWGVEYLNVYNLEDGNTVAAQKLPMVAPTRIFSFSLEVGSGFMDNYDVEDSILVTDPSTGDLFLVFQRVDKCCGSNYYELLPCSRVTQFRLFKLSLSEQRWLPIHCLHDGVLFIDCTGAKLISATTLNCNDNASHSQQHLVQPNSVYFAHTYVSKSDSGSRTHTFEQDFGMFSLMDGSINYFPRNQDIHLEVPTQCVWFTPTLG